MNKEEILKHYYGYDRFRPAQAEIIETILSKRDVLAIMPTSAGKSICFQVPALMLDGITIVVSPLISLMYDQVTSLKEMGIKAILLNSAMTSLEYYQAIEQLQRGEVKLLYVAPERFEQEGFLEMMQGIQISMVAVDEAHCISQWGQDFRPSYQNIDTFVAQLPTRPIVAAFTATATPRVRLDIKQQLKLQHPFEVVTSFDRANLYFGMEEPRDKMSRLLELIKEKESTIVFCNTRKEVEKVCEKLQKKGIAADWYHAGLSPEARSKVQEDFIFDRIDVIVATNAFGMGIDKSNVRKVIHYNMPKDIESYYQEAGRAGRDGEPAECILLYGAKDIIINKFLVKQNEDKVGMAKLNEMIDYCRTVRCLRGFMLDYFGQKDIPEDCGHCTNCLNKVTLTDVTPQAQMILSCIIRMKERYGMSKVSEVLRGSKRAEMKALHFDQLSTYGIMKDYSDKALKEFISSLIADRYIETEGLQYPILQVSELGKKALKNREKIEVKPIVAQILQKPDAIQQHQVQDNAPFDEVLYDRLRSLRMDLAFDQNVPPFLVFSDKTLKEFCRHLPTTDREFLQISGVGEKKLETYGEAFMKVIREYKS
jgi:ATP-dependent DNA helicase recQ